MSEIKELRPGDKVMIKEELNLKPPKKTIFGKIPSSDVIYTVEAVIKMDGGEIITFEEIKMGFNSDSGYPIGVEKKHLVIVDKNKIKEWEKRMENKETFKNLVLNKKIFLN